MMREVRFEIPQGTAEQFHIEYDANHQIRALKHPKDSYEMNWIKGKQAFGTIVCERDLSVQICREYTEKQTLLERYVFRNDTDFDIYTLGTDLGIYVTLPDYYADAKTCAARCCSTHIWCGGASSYIMALRMGGAAPHLGMVLRSGSLQGYSVERMASTNGREEELSNHRGDFILHPENLHLRPGETYTLTWEWFWFENKEDFKEILKRTPDFVYVESDAYLINEGKQIAFSVSVSSEEEGEEPVVKRDGCMIPCKKTETGWDVWEEAANTGEYNYQIYWKGNASKASFLVMSELEELAEKRCNFIAKYQQCQDEGHYLDGAYLIYDNEEKQQYYGHRNDHNGGRERIGMGILMARYLQQHPNKMLEESLDNYVAYVLRELFDETTGEVFNDAPRCRDYIRLYNYPWMSRFFLELYHLKQEEEFLDRYYKSVEHFYQAGGTHFYAIGMPMYESVHTFCKAGREEQAEELLKYYQEQGEFIISCGRNYPAHEVNYEQSIVAPAAIYMCELYLLTKEEKYRRAAKEQLEVLDVFQGFQPDYHMNEVAIRHWDGYWFGKRKCLGDTYPHYWSALSGYAYTYVREIFEDSDSCKKAERTLKAVLSLIHEDGSASCAMVYPMSVNGKRAHFYETWANDQDWGLYFALKYLEKTK